MSAFFKTIDSYGRLREVNLEALPEFEEIKNRFQNEFPLFVREQKVKAVIATLQEELGSAIVLNMPRLATDVLSNLDDTTLIEKPYVFISVNPQVLI